MNVKASQSIDALKAVAHPLRHQILAVLASGERNVGDIESETEIGQPALSQQLAVLRSAGLVMTRREAKLVFYRSNAPALTALADALTALLPDVNIKTVVAGNAPPVAKARSSAGVAMFAKLV